jgi:hypothetical protein
MVGVALVRLAAALASCFVLCTSCVTYGEELNRAQRHFHNNEYEQALAIFRALESDIDSLPPPDRARYAYLRGMSDYRMSLRPDARHWLALARAYEESSQGGLEEGWRERMKSALQDLDDEFLRGLSSRSAALATVAADAGPD